MAEKTIQGSDCIIKVYNGTAYVPFVCSKDISLEIATNKIETTTLGGGQWLNFDYQNLSWTITLSGALVMDSDNWHALDWFQAQTNFLKLDVVIEYKDNTNAYYTAIGQVMVDRTMLQTNVGQIGLSDLTLQGCKELQIIAGLYECDAIINSVTLINGTGPEPTGSLAVNTSPDTVYIIYSFDGGATITEATYTDFTTYKLFTIYYTGTFGAHTVTVTPYCSNDLNGTPEIDYPFTILFGA